MIITGGDIEKARRGFISAHDTPVGWAWRFGFRFGGHGDGHGLLDLAHASEDPRSDGTGPGRAVSGTEVAETALEFLLRNAEWERAEALKNAVIGLRSLTEMNPWRIRGIEGLAEAMQRAWHTSEDSFAIPEAAKVRLVCNREGYRQPVQTVMDMIRMICWSEEWKREILPRNLRRFDAWVAAFPQNVAGVWSSPRSGELDLPLYREWIPYAGNEAKPDLTDGVIYELLDCEFDTSEYTGPAAGMAGDEPGWTVTEPAIPIIVGRVRKNRYSAVHGMDIGDFTRIDTHPGATREEIDKLLADGVARAWAREETEDRIPLPKKPEDGGPRPERQPEKALWPGKAEVEWVRRGRPEPRSISNGGIIHSAMLHGWKEVRRDWMAGESEARAREALRGRGL